MAKMIDVEALKPLLKDFIPADNTSVIEGIMAASVDTDDAAVQTRIDEAVQTRIDEAVATAQKEAADNYAKQLHDMFFNGIKPENVDNTVTGDPLNGTGENKPAASIFVTEDA